MKNADFENILREELRFEKEEKQHEEEWLRTLQSQIPVSFQQQLIELWQQRLAALNQSISELESLLK